MHSLKIVLRLTGNLFRGEFLQWRTQIALLLTLPVLYMCRMEGAEGLHMVEPFVSAWSWVFGASTLTLCLLVIQSAAPFFHRNESFVASRVGRWPWMCARVLYMLSMSAFFLLFIWLGTLLLNFSAIDWRVSTLSPTALSSTSPIDFDLTEIPPWPCFFWVFLLAWLYVSFFALLIFALNLRLPQGVGVAVAMGVCGIGGIFGSISASALGLNPVYFPAFHLLLFQHNLPWVQGAADLSDWPTLPESLAYLGGLVLLLLVIIALLIPGYAFACSKNRLDDER